ncbi:hypothetical protein [Glycomyces harbinensis]|uniref:Uncharacterized protein n=1 Tax=Glycomyces harbinensis TaxID=58114 RepID=A0A1G6ZIJ9_9ACTN|nr:hypothetical protein [Glycomyces harbinensis]SDE02574.1 hypothetical protein SAMN05216270_11134 [Glycomyces harbinensis]
MQMIDTPAAGDYVMLLLFAALAATGLALLARPAARRWFKRR